MEKIRVYFTTAYGGGVKANVVIGEEHNGKTMAEIEKLKKKKGYIPSKTYVLELDYLEKYLQAKIEKHGYTTSMTSRQKYPRISFNVER